MLSSVLTGKVSKNFVRAVYSRCIDTSKIKVLTSTTNLSRLYADLLKKTSTKNEVDILGTLHSTIRGLWKYEAVLDAWPDFNALALRPLQMIPRQAKYQEVYLCGNSKSLKDLLMHGDTLPWNECITFRACPLKLKSILEGVTRCHGGSLLDVDGEYYRFVVRDDGPPKTNWDEKLPKGFYLGQLKESDAPFVQQCWNEFAAEHNHCHTELETIKHLTKYSLTPCVYDAANTPVSWAILHHSGALLSGYTLPEYRGHWLSHAVFNYFFKIAVDFGQPHLHTISAVGNDKAVSVVREFAMIIPHNVTYYHYIPNSLKSSI